MRIPQLNDLEERVAISNQTIIAAEASYRAAHALVLEAQAQLFPTLSLAPSVIRENSSVGAAGLGGSGVAATGVRNIGRRRRIERRRHRDRHRARAP